MSSEGHHLTTLLRVLHEDIQNLKNDVAVITEFINTRDTSPPSVVINMIVGPEDSDTESVQSAPP